MSYLKLYFTNGKGLQLQKTCFAHPILPESSEVVSLRGSVNQIYHDAGSFTWSSGVQALALFFLRVKELECSGQADSAALIGEAKTPAATFDYAVTKCPNWILDIFGSDSSGAPIVRRVVKRQNSERKLPGPVSIALNSKFLPAASIHCFIDDREMGSLSEFRSAALELNSHWRSIGSIRRTSTPEIETGECDDDPSDISLLRYADAYASPVFRELESKLKEQELVPVPKPLDSPILSSQVRKFFLDEVATVIEDAEIFSSRKLELAVKRIRGNRMFEKIAGKSASLISDLEWNLTESARLGITDDKTFIRQELSRDVPLRISLSHALPGALVILLFMKFLRGYNLDIDFTSATSAETVSKIVNGRYTTLPDICIIGLAPAAQLLGKKGKTAYRPLMLMPKGSHRVVLPASRKKVGNNGLSGDFLFMTEAPASASFYFEDLVSCGVVNKKKVNVNHATIGDVFDLFSEDPDGANTISVFPHYRFNQLFNNCKLIQPTDQGFANKESIMFVHDSLYSETKRLSALNLAVRDAWLELKGAPELQTALVSYLMEDRDYLKTLIRFSGLHNVSGAIFNHSI